MRKRVRERERGREGERERGREGDRDRGREGGGEILEGTLLITQQSNYSMKQHTFLFHRTGRVINSFTQSKMLTSSSPELDSR